MTRVDLHVHSASSKHPTEWFLKKIGAQESYTAVEDLYRIAKERGMTYVTCTDHNAIDGALRLVERHPEDTFVSSEITTYFPEDGCKVHVLVYGITEAQFASIQEVRDNIHDLRNYLRSEDIACAVAHATYSINNRLTVDAVEKLVLLFNVFESINGTRNRRYNTTLDSLLRNLSAADIDRLHGRHGIEPWSDDAWIKGYTGGSDDHAGLLIGETYTESDATSIPDLLRSIRGRETKAGGRHGDHKTLAFAIYKIAYEYSKGRTPSPGSGAFGILNELIFEDGPIGVKHWLAMQKLKLTRDSHGRVAGKFFEDLVDHRTNATLSTEERLTRVYDALASMSDEYFAMIATSIEKGTRDGDAFRLIKNLSAALPVAFLTAPFFSTLRHLNSDNALMTALKDRFGVKDRERDHRLLWFSDTVDELNGVAVTMRSLARCAHETGRSMSLVASIPPGKERTPLPPNVMNVPCIYDHTPQFYNAFSVRVPSVLKSIDAVAAFNPDEIVVSTPGPVGVLGLIAARILNLKCTGIYHTDFKKQAEMFIGDDRSGDLVEAYVRFFYNLLDEVRVPTRQYMGMLAERGLDRDKMKIFRRGVEASFCVDDKERQAALREQYHIPEGPVLLWAGRLGKEKNLDFLFEVFRAAMRERPGVALVIAGDGPEYERLQRENASNPYVIFTGRIRRHDLPHFYGLADCFVFPSTTDTFGMVVLEAQACGLPCLVTDVGGPQEIVHDGETGRVIDAHDAAAWVKAITDEIDQLTNDPEGVAAKRQKTRDLFGTNFTWSRVLEEFMGPKPDDGEQGQQAPTPAQ